MQVRYELCDAVKGSDHRPVSAVYVLRVNEAVDGPSSIGDLIPMKLTITEVRWMNSSGKMVQDFF